MTNWACYWVETRDGDCCPPPYYIMLFLRFRWQIIAVIASQEIYFLHHVIFNNILAQKRSDHQPNQLPLNWTASIWKRQTDQASFTILVLTHWRKSPSCSLRQPRRRLSTRAQFGKTTDKTQGLASCPLWGHSGWALCSQALLHDDTILWRAHLLFGGQGWNSSEKHVESWHEGWGYKIKWK